MGTRLSPETEATLRKLAREIGNSRGLDDDAQEELYGHLEDKTLGYLSGEDGITEADAVLLTREHFGIPGTLAGGRTLAEVPLRSGVFVRRVAAIAIADLVLGAVFASTAVAVGLTAYPYLNLTPPGVRTVIDWAMIWRLLLPGAISLMAVLGWSALRLLRHKTSDNRWSWYLQWNPYVIAAVLAVLLAVRLWQHADPLGVSAVLLGSGSIHAGFALMASALSLVPVVWACIWIYWIAQANRSVTAMAIGGLVWYLLRILTGQWPAALLNLPLILTVTMVYVLSSRLSTKYGVSTRGVPWVSN